MMTSKDISYRIKKTIHNHIDKLVKKYGFKSFRLIALKYISGNVRANKLQKEIERREEELQELRNKK